jgi:hypothetical protein
VMTDETHRIIYILSHGGGRVAPLATPCRPWRVMGRIRELCRLAAGHGGGASPRGWAVRVVYANFSKERWNSRRGLEVEGD